MIVYVVVNVLIDTRISISFINEILIDYSETEI